MTDNPYDRLGVPKDASPEVARRAYRQRAKCLHPDAGGSAADMAQLTEAYHDVMRHGRRDAGKILRAPRREPRAPIRTIAWSDAAEQFTRLEFQPQARLLGLGLDRLDLEVQARLNTPGDAGRDVRLREVAGQAGLALSMAGSRLARASWPADLAVARGLVGEALRNLSDALLELQEELDTDGVFEARRTLALGRTRLREVWLALPSIV